MAELDYLNGRDLALLSLLDWVSSPLWRTTHAALEKNSGIRAPLTVFATHFDDKRVRAIRYWLLLCKALSAFFHGGLQIS